MGVLHRDLKPQNILLQEEIPKIVDWGLSKVMAEDRSSYGHVFSLYWAAPEQISSDRYGKPDFRTDIYQLGAIFYELLTGKPPFQGDNVTEVMARILNDRPSAVCGLNPDAEGVEPIVQKCLRKEKNGRYQAVQEVQDDLAEYLKTRYKALLDESEGDGIRSKHYSAELVLLCASTGDWNGAMDSIRYLAPYVSAPTGDELLKSIEELRSLKGEGREMAEALVDRVATILYQAQQSD